MAPDFLGSFLGGKGGGLPGFASSSSAAAIGGTNLSPWYQGDVVVAGGDARVDRAGVPGQAVLGNATSPPVLIAGLIVLGVVLWRRMAK